MSFSTWLMEEDEDEEEEDDVYMEKSLDLLTSRALKTSANLSFSSTSPESLANGSISIGRTPSIPFSQDHNLTELLMVSASLENDRVFNNLMANAHVSPLLLHVSYGSVPRSRAWNPPGGNLRAISAEHAS